jgi:hypothetical protein
VWSLGGCGEVNRCPIHRHVASCPGPCMCVLLCGWVGVCLLACECGAFSVLRHLSPFSS